MSFFLSFFLSFFSCEKRNIKKRKKKKKKKKKKKILNLNIDITCQKMLLRDPISPTIPNQTWATSV